MRAEGKAEDGESEGKVSELPTLTDGTLTLRPWRPEDDAAFGADQEQSTWPMSPRHLANYVITHQNAVVGRCAIDAGQSSASGKLRWALLKSHHGRGFATRAVRALSDWALTEEVQQGLGLTRVEARVDPNNQAAMRVATRSGLRREGVERIVRGTGISPDTTEYVVFARLSTDPPLTDPASFRTLLNSFLPRKRAIAQMLIRDNHDRVLMCQLTYKADWDLPGGVVEVGESPHEAVTREVQEELGLTLPAGELLLTDWLPAWSGWDDALCLVFDGGQHSPDILEWIVRQEREIRSAAFCTPSQMAERTKDFTASRIHAALARIDGSGPSFTHSGKPAV